MHCVESCLQKSSTKCQNSIPKSIQLWKPKKGNASSLDITPITGSLSHNRSSVLNYNLKILPHLATSRFLKMSREAHGQAILSIALFPRIGSGDAVSITFLWTLSISAFSFLLHGSGSFWTASSLFLLPIFSRGDIKINP